MTDHPLVCMHNHGNLQLWDATTGMVLADYKGHTDDVTCSDLAPSGKYVVSCSEDCTVKVHRTHLMVSVY